MYDADIAGEGIDSLSGSHIWYAVARIITVPPSARILEVASDGHILRAGWISFGDTLSVIGATSRDYWRSVWWLDFIDSLWTPVPSTGEGGGPLALAASRVQWSIPTGGLAHLYVFGA
jgi:hypothetical protein